MRFARAPRDAVVVAPSTSRNATTNTMPNMSVSASPDWSQNSGDSAMMRVAHKATGQLEFRRSKT
jgi:hypothetical protein